MARYAKVIEGVVVNVEEWDGIEYDPETHHGWSPPEGATMILSETAGIGDAYDGKAFTRSEPEPLPESTPTFEDHIVDLLEQIGKADTLDDVKSLAKLTAQKMRQADSGEIAASADAPDTISK